MVLYYVVLRKCILAHKYNKTDLFPLWNPFLTCLKPRQVTPLCSSEVIKTQKSLFGKINGNENIIFQNILNWKLINVSGHSKSQLLPRDRELREIMGLPWQVKYVSWVQPKAQVTRQVCGDEARLGELHYWERPVLLRQGLMALGPWVGV